MDKKIYSALNCRITPISKEDYDQLKNGQQIKISTDNYHQMYRKFKECQALSAQTALIAASGVKPATWNHPPFEIDNKPNDFNDNLEVSKYLRDSLAVGNSKSQTIITRLDSAYGGKKGSGGPDDIARLDLAKLLRDLADNIRKSTISNLSFLSLFQCRIKHFDTMDDLVNGQVKNGITDFLASLGNKLLTAHKRLSELSTTDQDKFNKALEAFKLEADALDEKANEREKESTKLNYSPFTNFWSKYDFSDRTLAYNTATKGLESRKSFNELLDIWRNEKEENENALTALHADKEWIDHKEEITEIKTILSTYSSKSNNKARKRCPNYAKLLIPLVTKTATFKIQPSTIKKALRKYNPTIEILKLSSRARQADFLVEKESELIRLIAKKPPRFVPPSMSHPVPMEVMGTSNGILEIKVLSLQWDKNLITPAENGKKTIVFIIASPISDSYLLLQIDPRIFSKDYPIGRSFEAYMQKAFPNIIPNAEKEIEFFTSRTKLTHNEVKKLLVDLNLGRQSKKEFIIKGASEDDKCLSNIDKDYLVDFLNSPIAFPINNEKKKKIIKDLRDLTPTISLKVFYDKDSNNRIIQHRLIGRLQISILPPKKKEEGNWAAFDLSFEKTPVAIRDCKTNKLTIKYVKDTPSDPVTGTYRNGIKRIKRDYGHSHRGKKEFYKKASKINKSNRFYQSIHNSREYSAKRRAAELLNLLVQGNVKTVCMESLSGKTGKDFNSKANSKSSNKAYLNVLIPKFESFVRQGCAKLGISVKNVNPCLSSKLCNKCGELGFRYDSGKHYSKDIKARYAKCGKSFCCQQCKRFCNADINAVQNILDWGMYPDKLKKSKKTKDFYFENKKTLDKKIEKLSLNMIEAKHKAEKVSSASNKHNRTHHQTA